MIKINLLGKKKEKVPFGLDPILARVGIGSDELSALRPLMIKLAVVVAFWCVCEYTPPYLLQMKVKELDDKVKVVQEKTTKFQNELNSKKELRKQMEKLEKEEAEINRQLNAINALSKNRGLVFRTMDSVTTLLPKKVWLSKINYGQSKLSLEGSSWEYFPINDFVKALNENTQFQNILFKGITTETSGAILRGIPEAMQKIKKFTVEFDVNNG